MSNEAMTHSENASDKQFDPYTPSINYGDMLCGSNF